MTTRCSSCCPECGYCWRRFSGHPKDGARMCVRCRVAARGVIVEQAAESVARREAGIDLYGEPEGALAAFEKAVAGVGDYVPAARPRPAAVPRPPAHLSAPPAAPVPAAAAPPSSSLSEVLDLE